MNYDARIVNMTNDELVREFRRSDDFACEILAERLDAAIYRKGDYMRELEKTVKEVEDDFRNQIDRLEDDFRDQIDQVEEQLAHEKRRVEESHEENQQLTQEIKKLKSKIALYEKG